jgi:EpsI family protein
MKDLRFWIVALLLLATAFVLHSRGNRESTVAGEPLAQFPSTIDGWTGTDQPIDAESLEILGPGVFLSRIYAKGGSASPIGLFIGYFPTQRSGVSIHSPKHCLPGAGWVFDSSDYVTLNAANGKPHRVGEYIISNGDQRQFVIYWYEAHGRSVASEYAAKIYLVADAIRMNRTDGALVRVIVPVIPSESLATARSRAEAFAVQLMPTLPRFIPD